MVDALLAVPSLTDTQRAAIEAAKGEYEATWDDAVVDSTQGATSGGQATTKEWKFHAAQLTFNCTQGEWASKAPAVLKALFLRFLAFAQAFATQLKVEHLSVAMEESEENHVHIHAYFNCGTVFHHKGRNALDVFCFENIHPHIVPNRASGGAYAGAVRHGHFYVVVDKIGSLHTWTDFRPFKDYPVEAWWLDNLLKQGKLTHDVYLGYGARLGVGFQRRLADVAAAQRYLMQKAVEEAVKAAQAELGAITFPMKDFPEVEEFLGCFLKQLHRRPVLAIIGGTNLGKSMLGAHVLRKLGQILGLGTFVEIAVEMNPHLDFADFDWARDAGALLDGVGDAYILKKNREALQGRPKLTKGGQSATNVYSYSYTLFKRGVVATFDLSAKNLQAFERDHWLSNRQYVIVLRLMEKAFVEPPATPRADAQTQTTPGTPEIGARTKRRWVSAGPSQAPHAVPVFPVGP